MKQVYKQLELPFEEDLRTRTEVYEDALMSALFTGQATINIGGVEASLDYRYFSGE